ncbi:hypothetical protein NQ784_03650 [Acinetobacter baumannii]|nr:hypothetical protein [Acinetobacter baumannii]
MNKREKALSFVNMLNRKIVDAEELLIIRPYWIKECGVCPKALEKIIANCKKVDAWGGLNRVQRILESAINHKQNHKLYGNPKAKSIKALTITATTTCFWESLPERTDYILLRTFKQIVEDAATCGINDDSKLMGAEG